MNDLAEIDRIYELATKGGTTGIQKAYAMEVAKAYPAVAAELRQSRSIIEALANGDIDVLQCSSETWCGWCDDYRTAEKPTAYEAACEAWEMREKQKENEHGTCGGYDDIDQPCDVCNDLLYVTPVIGGTEVECPKCGDGALRKRNEQDFH